MRFNLAILSVLAARPGERIAIDEVSREVKRMIAAGDEATQSKRPSELGDADVFQSGWASINDAGLQITDSGLSLWRSLEASRIEQRLDQQETERLDTVAADTRHPGADTAIDRPDGVDLELAGMTCEDRDDRQPSSESRSTTAAEIPSGTLRSSLRLHSARFRRRTARLRGYPVWSACSARSSRNSPARGDGDPRRPSRIVVPIVEAD
ncbi:hypothetical protein ACQPTN_19425 [Bradyrhizobium sp. 13971]